jgi:GMP synthase-like glutamine amidotransferase
MSCVDALPILVVESDAADRVGRLGDWLVDSGAKLDVRYAPGESLPSDLSQHSGLIVMGGAMGAVDDHVAPWLAATRKLLASAVAERVPTLGVCLGAQLLAVATGGRVARAAEPEYGALLVAKRQAAAQDPLFAALPITPDTVAWHVDEIQTLPANAVLLASSPSCEVQAFRVGSLAWGIQFHIETTDEVVRAWAESDRDRLIDYDLERMLAAVATSHEFIGEVWPAFAAQFAAVCASPQEFAARPGLPMASAVHSVHSVHSAQPITDAAAIRAALAAELQASRGPSGPPRP